MKTCPNCGKEVTGREGKKFCSPYCKSNYHYEKNKQKESSMFKKIDKQLKLNRRILKNYNRSGKATVNAEELFKHGFDPAFFTHYWRNSKKQVYFFCYEFGFISFKDEKNNRKFTLVKWQAYMEK